MNLLAVSDLHVSYAENRDIVDGLRPGSDGDWLIVAGDVAERMSLIEETLRRLRDRFAQVIWSPGNHELWTTRDDEVQLRGVARYEALVEMCRGLGVRTPEDDFLVWQGEHGESDRVMIAPLFVGYDYTFRPEGCDTKEQSLAKAHETGVVCTDEYFLHPDPYPSREAWCEARVAESERRLSACDPEIPLVMVNHYPLVRDPTRVLYYPEFAQWCGTVRTADWHTRFNTAAMIYGHLHIPRITWHDGIRFQEVSLGYPREWRRHGNPHGILRQILPALESV
ncbi:3',5'-cyclic AMP phosphodiesterase CpdA [Herbihabitans rhizosphaerae]|uniref:3',5'-cyclic AMP phosphodiesterase CpdA n=1 Tax=Herbihabitans rhizosphaerae TaxID=1872711 RepID=A0A4Q7KJ26_9PSEU|nr:metallophosphoesterase [Herbihabitans rhizosphaerae]RZS36568.1 3',5'-cyclic AMP phosphodiesterase CpdA [Herbihabitans rhizosphaerae]